jgi:hypothetical protein
MNQSIPIFRPSNNLPMGKINKISELQISTLLASPIADPH